MVRLPAASEVTLRLFDVSGRLVGTFLNHQSLARGAHRVFLAASHKLGSGVYFYRLGDGRSEVKGRLVIVR
jgi:hypothetical protein